MVGLKKTYVFPVTVIPVSHRSATPAQHRFSLRKHLGQLTQLSCNPWGQNSATPRNVSQALVESNLGSWLSGFRISHADIHIYLLISEFMRQWSRVSVCDHKTTLHISLLFIPFTSSRSARTISESRDAERRRKLPAVFSSMVPVNAILGAIDL